MWAVEVLGKDSQFCQETREITAAARPWCADGEGCVTGEESKGVGGPAGSAAVIAGIPGAGGDGAAPERWPKP